MIIVYYKFKVCTSIFKSFDNGQLSFIYIYIYINAINKHISCKLKVNI